ncbi:MAG: class I SAM-dependent methyltransferase [Desulfuromonas sp.]|nr:class I SAM-dependent methyltransferase [Desulfuromonas sp.]
MKVRDSGMPDEAMWAGFFDPDAILRTFGIDAGVTDLVEFGCGYGTFTLAAARAVSGTVYALDIEAELISLVQEKCRQSRIVNVQAMVRDFVGEGCGLTDDSMDVALLFNILHHDDPIGLMSEAWRVLKPGASLAVIHWNYDPSTPRGPAMEIRPKPEQCVAWGLQAGFPANRVARYDFPPYHYGFSFVKQGHPPK